MSALAPTLHKPVPLQTRVQIPESYLGPTATSFTGRVVGIASMHVIFTYIVLLDQTLQTDEGPTDAVVVPGSDLMNEGGTYAWRLTTK
jgi:hypothetical protein